MASKKFEPGDKATIRKQLGAGGWRLTGVVVVESVGARVIKTSDGRRWSALFHSHEVDAKGSKIGGCSLKQYDPGDEERVARHGRLDKARRLLDGHEWKIREDFALLSDEDLDALGGIVDRLNAARHEAAKKAEGAR